ncbi:MAG: hypothetical protein AB1540_16620, partial [Bdellovibrionota bacterium]
RGEPMPTLKKVFFHSLFCAALSVNASIAELNSDQLDIVAAHAKKVLLSSIQTLLSDSSEATGNFTKELPSPMNTSIAAEYLKNAHQDAKKSEIAERLTSREYTERHEQLSKMEELIKIRAKLMVSEASRLEKTHLTVESCLQEPAIAYQPLFLAHEHDYVWFEISATQGKTREKVLTATVLCSAVIAAWYQDSYEGGLNQQGCQVLDLRVE